jgi:hypothetical protein
VVARASLGIVAILCAAALVGVACGRPVDAQPTGVRCFQDQAPPPKRVRPDAELLVGIGPGDRSANECPMSEPPPGAPCALPRLPATDAQGAPVEVWARCWYAREGVPCEPDLCTCRRSAEGAPPTFSCDRPTID